MARISKSYQQVETRRVPKGALRKEVGTVVHGVCGKPWPWGTEHKCEKV